MTVPDLTVTHNDFQQQQGTLPFETNALDEAFKTAEIPVKLELRYAIEAKRAEKGLDMPILDEIPRLRRQLTVEEEERRRLRRERNKVAASRCRVKRKCHVKRLLKESDDLTKINTSLEDEIDKLQYEKQQLEGAIRNHVCKFLPPSPESDGENQHVKRCYGS